MEENTFVSLEETNPSIIEDNNKIISPINNTYSTAKPFVSLDEIPKKVIENVSVPETKPGDLISNLPSWDLTPPLVVERGGTSDIL